MNMIEKVAKAIRDNYIDNNYIFIPSTSVAEGLAKAAIEAMREPSKGMLNTNDPVAAIEMSKVYQAMIDAALKE